MAKATRIQEEVPAPLTVRLELTEEEARTLRHVIGNVSGSHRSPRRHADSIYSALADAGVSWQGTKEVRELSSGEVHFYDYANPAARGCV